MLLPDPLGLQPLGNPSDSDTLPLPQGRAQTLHTLFGTDSDNDAYDAGDEFAQPYTDDNWYDDREFVSGLDTSPNQRLVAPPGPPWD